MVRTAEVIHTTLKSIRRKAKPPRKMRSTAANAAAFGPTDRNAVTGAGAPWYTSGVQI